MPAGAGDGPAPSAGAPIRATATATLALAALAAASLPLEAQEEPPVQEERPVRADTVERPRPPGATAGSAAAGPPSGLLRERGGDHHWARWAERAGGLATLLAADRAVRRTAQDLRRQSPEASVPDELAQVGNDVGTWQKSVPFLVGGALAGGALLDGARGVGRGASLLGGVLAGSMASEALNRMVGRGRPVWGRGAYSLRPFSGHASFPSGHAAYLFSVAGGVDAVTDGWLPAAAAYGVAGISAYGRLYADKHWLSDVVVGAVVGATVSRMATRRAMRMLGVAGEDDGPGGRAGRGDRGDRSPSEAQRGPDVSLLATPSRLGVRIRF